ncbi:MAG: tRNA(Met) cytidine acetyltransferase, partial [Thermoprotei archaeon]
VNVIRLMEKLYEKIEDGKIAIVVTADRGRGKSCAIGIGTAALSHKLRRAKGRVRILVTAPHISNVQSLFDLTKRTLEELDYNVESTVEEGFTRALKAKGITIEYFKPLEVLRRQGDIVVVDEAAGLQVPMLFGIYRKFNKLVFSSTIHGYEGSGRGFSVRFLSLLRRDQRTEVYECEMEEPIRYAMDDPVEHWLFDTLLLDAEPVDLNEDDLKFIDKMQVEYYAPKLEEFFLESDEALRQFIGIYVMAHYRNNPDDLGIMMDAPHHTIRYLSLPSGKIVTAIELAEEGGIPREIAKKLALGAWIAGNIVPDRFVKHTRSLEFGELKGWRIVRIATHPKVQGRGLGSKALEFIVEEGRRRGYDWIGAGFGVNYELLRFWLKNGFIPIHISPDRNPVSGEYSVIVVRPLTEKASKLIKVANREFRARLLHSLHEPYHDLNPKVARLLLTSDTESLLDDFNVKFTPVQICKLLGYSWNLMTIENCFDSVLKMVRKYFADRSENRPKLSGEEEIILIVRVLQAKSWRVSCEQLRKSPPELMDAVRAIVRQLCIHYLNASENMMKEYFVTLDSL